MHFLRLSIHQTYGQIGIETHLARQEMESPKGEQTIIQKPATMDFESPRGELLVDSSAAWEALAKGGIMKLTAQIYSQMKGFALQAIAKTVEEGNRMAYIPNKRNAFAELAENWLDDSNPIQYVGEASNMNVKLDYIRHEPQTRIEPNRAETRYEPVKPRVQYIPGNVDIYMKQMNAIQIQVSEYDWYK